MIQANARHNNSETFLYQTHIIATPINPAPFGVAALTSRTTLVQEIPQSTAKRTPEQAKRARAAGIRTMAVVEVVTSELVAPSEPTPRRPLWLSNLDLAARNGYTPTIYFFRRPQDSSDGRLRADSCFSTHALRAALAAALVRFYPFAGRLRAAGRGGRAEIDCNAAGALLVVARSAAALEDFLHDFAPSKAMNDTFVPTYDSAGPDAPLLLLQVR